MTVPSAAGRRAGGRFLPGRSGNPAGRPRGSRNKLTVVKEALRRQDVDSAIRIIGDGLAKGSPTMARFVIRQIDGGPRAPRVALEVQPGASLEERFQALFRAAARGEIAPAEAAQLAEVL